MRSEEVEAYIGSQLELSHIEFARYHVLASANHIHQCLSAINYHTTIDSNEETSNTYYEYQDNAKEIFDKGDTSIDCLTWLKCRRLLSSRLSDEDNAVGRLAGPKSLVGRVGSFEEYVQNTLVECKIFNDTSSACVLKLLQIQNDLKCGKDTNDIVQRLKVREFSIF